MSVEGVDYSFAQPSPAGLAAAGKKFAMVYVGPGSAGKHLTPAHRDALFAAGLSIVLLVEGAEGDMLTGYATGRAHAQSAEAGRLALGAPALPLYFAADKDMTSANLPAINAYLQGAASVIGVGRVGTYGEYDVMRWTRDAGTARWSFQTYGWSSGKWYAGNHVEQYRNGQSLAGGTVDLCRAKTDQYGQWTRGGATTIEEDEVTALEGIDRTQLSNSEHMLQALLALTDAGGIGNNAGNNSLVTQNALAVLLKQIATDAAAAAKTKPAVTVDADTLASAFRLALQDPATLAAVAKAVNDDDARRMAS